MHWRLAAIGVAALAHPGAGADTIDINQLSKDKIEATCAIGSYASAEDCFTRLLPTLRYRASHYAATNATYMVRVTHDPARPPSVGSGFLVDHERNFVLTAKHVLLGDIDWSYKLKDTLKEFADLDTAVEDFLSSPRARLEIQVGADFPPVPVRLVAIDRNSDLALLQIINRNTMLQAQYKSSFQEIPLAPERRKCEDLQVIALGFQEAGAGIERRPPDTWTRAQCVLQPNSYVIGMHKYRIPLLTTALQFKAGNSGGPVLDDQFHLVGVVSGAKTSGGGSTVNNYFVPVSAVRSFLNRFR